MKKDYKSTDNDVLVSIIVPAYNCAKTIKKCVSSIMEQNYSNFELIIINDGSTDSTEQEILELKGNNSKIRYFYQTNSGVSASRNKGIIEASGGYICFVDSDDVVLPNYLNELISKVNDYDYVAAKYTTDLLDKETSGKDFSFTNKQSFFKEFFSVLKSGILNPPYCKLYRKEIIDNYNIRFNEALSMGEDLQFNLEYINHCNSFYFSEKIIYYYNQNESYLTKKYHVNLFDSRVLSIDGLYNFLVKNNLSLNIVYFMYLKLVCAELIQDIAFKKITFKSMTLKIDSFLEKDVIIQSLKNYKIQLKSNDIIVLIFKTRNIFLIKCLIFMLYMMKYKLKIKIKRISV